MKGKSITFRPKHDHSLRLEALSKATEHTTTFFVEKSIEAHLPALEEKYSEELKDYEKKAGSKSFYGSRSNELIRIEENANQAALPKKRRQAK